jgi:hypothetical protein
MTKKDIRNEKRRIMKFRESAPPPIDDHEATVRWLRDREVIKNLYHRYAYGVDSIDFDLVRTVFHPDCVCVGTAEQGQLDEYLDGMEEALHAWDASMHFVGNQYVEIDGDEGFVESWVVGYHMEAETTGRSSVASPRSSGTPAIFRDPSSDRRRTRGRGASPSDSL